MVAGLIAAAVAVVLLVGWQRFMSWHVFRSGFTDLPGQDTLRLVGRLEPFVLALITLVAGRLAGFMSSSRRWLAALIGVLPLVLPLVLLFLGFGQPGSAAIWSIVICLIGLFGAYAPAWLSRRNTGLLDHDHATPPQARPS
jgi:hypothetical protein